MPALFENFTKFKLHPIVIIQDRLKLQPQWDSEQIVYIKLQVVSNVNIPTIHPRRGLYSIQHSLAVTTPVIIPQITAMLKGIIFDKTIPTKRRVFQGGEEEI